MLKNNNAGIFVIAMLLGWLAFTPIAGAQEKFSPCKPVQAATFTNRIHVRCESAVDGKFSFFAASVKDDPKFAARALSVIEAGQLGDKFVLVLFDPNDQSGTDFGCLLTDCRTMRGVILTEDRPGKCSIDNTQKGCPGFCAAVGNNDRSCPGFCAAHPTDRQCFCATHDDMTCPGNCVRNPDNPKCNVNSDECRNSHLPGCNERPR